MPGFGRIVMAGMTHHVVHRGRKCAIFGDDADRKTYLRILREQCIRLALRIWAYALMTNHVHLIAVPSKADTLSMVLRNAHGTYTDYFNAKYSYVGHLFGERFRSSILDEPYLWNAVRYVERNPVRAGLVARAEDYEWSSAPAHCGRRNDQLLSNDLPMLTQIKDWSAWLRDEPSEEETSFTRRQTQMGRPCGDNSFLRYVGSQLGRELTPTQLRREEVEIDASSRTLPFED